MKFPYLTGELTTDRKDGVLTITFNRPEVYNAWTEAQRDELILLLQQAESDDGVGAIVVTGAGRNAFCAGQDLREKNEGSNAVETGLDRMKRSYDAIRAFSKPLVAAVNGVAAGSGFQLTQFCDYVVAHPGVRMGQTEVASGLPSVFGTWLMSERIGSRAYELSLQGRLMEASEARALGFIHELVEAPRVLEAARAAAGRLGEQPRIAFKTSKEAIRMFDQERYARAWEIAIAQYKIAFATNQVHEDVARMFEVRRQAKAKATAAA